MVSRICFSSKQFVDTGFFLKKKKSITNVFRLFILNFSLSSSNNAVPKWAWPQVESKIVGPFVLHYLTGLGIFLLCLMCVFF